MRTPKRNLHKKMEGRMIQQKICIQLERALINKAGRAGKRQSPLPGSNFVFAHLSIPVLCNKKTTAACILRFKILLLFFEFDNPTLEPTACNHSRGMIIASSNIIRFMNLEQGRGIFLGLPPVESTAFRRHGPSRNGPYSG
jgi:hypothetical protein